MKPGLHKTKLLALALFAGGSLFAAPPPATYIHRDYRRHEEYREPRPVPHGVWIAPRYSGHRYYPGYWRR